MTRVAITSDRFDAVAEPFAALGMVPVPLACIRVEKADESARSRAREAAARADLMVIASGRAVETLWPDGSMPGVDLAAVGGATATSARQAGGRVVVTGRSGLDDLIGRISDRMLGGLVVFPRAADTDPTALSRLRQLAPRLEEHVIYRTVPIPPADITVEAAAFGSPSAVRGWASSRGFDDLVVAVVGSTTCAEVARHRSPDVVAPQPSYSSLAQALRTHLEERT